MERGRRAGGASDGDEEESAWVEASRHADQHEQSRIYLQVPRPQRRRYFAYRKCLQLGKQVFGPQHPYILSSLKALNKWRVDGDRTLKRFFFVGHVLIFPRYRI